MTDNNLGPELIVGGDFSDPAGWTLDGTTIADGVLRRSGPTAGSGCLATQELTEPLANGLYRYSIDIVDTDNSDLVVIALSSGGQARLDPSSPPGTYSGDIDVWMPVSNAVIVNLGEQGVKVVDNFSLKRVL